MLRGVFVKTDYIKYIAVSFMEVGTFRKQNCFKVYNSLNLQNVRFKLLLSRNKKESITTKSLTLPAGCPVTVSQH